MSSIIKGLISELNPDLQKRLAARKAGQITSFDKPIAEPKAPASPVAPAPKSDVNPELQKRLAARKAGKPVYSGGLEEGADRQAELEMALQKARQITKQIKYDDTATDIIVQIQMLAEKFNIDKDSLESAIDDVYNAKNQLESAVYGLDEVFEEALQQSRWDDDEILDENLRKWFKEKWVRFGPDGKIRGDCARGDDSEGKPKCLPQSKAHSLGKKGRASAAARKRREDPNPERSGPAKNVATKKKSNEAMNPAQQAAIAINMKKHHKKPKNSLNENNTEGIVYATGPRSKGIDDVDLVFKNLRTNKIVASVIGNNDRDGIYEIRIDQNGITRQSPMFLATGNPQDDSHKHAIYKLSSTTGNNAKEFSTMRNGFDTKNNTYYGMNMEFIGDDDYWSFLENMIGDIMWEDDAIEAGYVDRKYDGDLVFTKQQDTAEAQDLEESFDQPYKLKWYPGDMDEVTAYAEIPNGDDLSIMFNLDANEEGEEAWSVEFYRNDSQEVTGEGDAHRIFATVLSAIQTFIKKYKPKRVIFSASKEVEPGQKTQSRANLYDRLVQRYAKELGFRAFRADAGDKVHYELNKIAKNVAEEQLDEKCWDTHKQVGMKSKGGKMVPNCVPKESVEEGHQQCPKCGGAMYEAEMMNEKKDACYYKVKSRYKVWPSAYASGALVKCRKKGASNWGTGGKKNEDTAYAGGMGQGGNAGQSYRKYKVKPSGIAQGISETEAVNRNDGDGWRWYDIKPAGK
jgi:hypothetical protein